MFTALTSVYKAWMCGLCLFCVVCTTEIGSDSWAVVSPTATPFSQSGDRYASVHVTVPRYVRACSQSPSFRDSELQQPLSEIWRYSSDRPTRRRLHTWLTSWVVSCYSVSCANGSIVAIVRSCIYGCCCGEWFNRIFCACNILIVWDSIYVDNSLFEENN